MCSRFTLHKNYNEQTPVRDKERSYLWTNSTKIEKSFEKWMKTVRKTSLHFFKVHWSSFVTRFYCIKPTHLSVLRFSGSFDTHYKGRILPQFYIQLIHFGAWILLFLAVWAAQGSMDKNWVYFSYFWGWFFKLFRGKKILFFKNIVNSICTEKLINIKVRKV